MTADDVVVVAFLGAALDLPRTLEDRGKMVSFLGLVMLGFRFGLPYQQNKTCLSSQGFACHLRVLLVR